MFTSREAILFFNTVRYLKPRQILSRAVFAARGRLKRHWEGSSESPGTVPDWSPTEEVAPFLAHGRFERGKVAKWSLTFLNESVDFAGRIDWAVPKKSRLWRYNLHYFDFLGPAGGLPADVGISLIEDWIASNPPGTRDAWDPFPLSLRIVNWIKHLNSCNAPRDRMTSIVASIFEQTLWLEKSLETHLLANHFFKNLKALVFAGLFFRNADGRRWLAKGMGLLTPEIREQILPDGGHFERSPMYHSMILEDCIDLINICAGRGDDPATELAQCLRPITASMISYLRGMTHPDGSIALFNDAAFGIEAEPQELYRYRVQVTGQQIADRASRARSFPDTGYYVMSPTAEDKLIIDCAPVGPDYQPGHSHCDTLSFELSLNGTRLIIDSGCYEYEDSEMRRYNRGNMGHNTLTVDGQNQSEVWGSHRCGRRAYPIYAELKELQDGTLVFEGAHDGYRRLRGKPVHRRKIVWTSDSISIEDTVEGKGIHDIELRLHVNPELRVDDDSGRIVIIHDGKRVGRITALGGAGPRVETGWYCPEFGKKLICPVIRIALKKTSLPLKTGWRVETA